MTNATNPKTPLCCISHLNMACYFKFKYDEIYNIF